MISEDSRRDDFVWRERECLLLPLPFLLDDDGLEQSSAL